MSKKITEKELKETTEKGSQEILNLIQKNRKSGLENLQRVVDSLESEIDKERVIYEQAELDTPPDQSSLCTNNTVRTIKRGLDSCLTSIEAINSLIDMIINDMGGFIHNLQQVNKSTFTGNIHTQVLLTILKEKGIVSEEELKSSWDDVWNTLTEKKDQSTHE